MYASGSPNQEYWESLWLSTFSRSAILSGDRFVVAQTRRHLKPGSTVLDAGCGTSATIYGLSRAGFSAVGADWAIRTLIAAKNVCPELRLQQADVRRLPYRDAAFDAVWSLGVIEHFYEGYGQVLREAARVLKPGGFLFLTVPTISPLRAFKIKQAMYPHWSDTQRDSFYQFVFHASDVLAAAQHENLTCVNSFGLSGTLGLCEDVPLLGSRLRSLSESGSRLARVAWRASDYILRPFSHHIRYFAFRKHSP